VVGKPVGILLGATLAIRIFRPEAPLAARFYLVAGSVAGLGFSVSMLFAELGLGGSALPAAKLAILSAMVVSGLVAAGALMGLRRSVTTG
jgi:Na+/H+ antiporter NhaA